VKPAPLAPVPAPILAVVEPPQPPPQADSPQAPAASIGVETEETVARANIAPAPPTAEAATSGQDSFPL
jgi:hypothetical protein